MSKLGLSSLIVAAAMALPAPLWADCAQPKSEKSSGKGTFGALFFGEGGGETPPMTPDQADYCESASRQVGEQAGPPPEEAKEEPIPDYVDRDPAYLEKEGTKPFPAPKRNLTDIRNIPRRWPGPLRRSKTSETKKPPRSIMDDNEELRDAPAAASRYSLWANLSTPLLLPAAKAREVSLDDAKVLGREDYDAHILSRRRASGSSIVAVPSASSANSVSGIVREENSMRAGAMPVTIELDIRETPGEYRDAVAALSRDTGFRIDERFEPRFLGTGHGKVSMRGWLRSGKLGEVMSRKEVLLVEVQRVVSAAARKGGLTDILVGVRIPMRSSPTEALKVAAGRLAENAGFQLIRTIGYQRIPGTSRMVLIVLGRVPVRQLSRVMGDPSVVKVAPAPGGKSDRALTRGSVASTGRWKAALRDTALPFSFPKTPLFWALLFILVPLLVLRLKLHR